MVLTFPTVTARVMVPRKPGIIHRGYYDFTCRAHVWVDSRRWEFSRRPCPGPEKGTDIRHQTLIWGAGGVNI